MKLLLLGATGLVGSRTLSLALSHEAFSEVIAPTRKSLVPNAKLVNPVGPELEQLVPLLVSSHKPDAVICALGTTQSKAGSKEAFRYVDYELPLVFARAMHALGVETYALVSAMGASTDSMSFYYRVKGEVERDIRRVGFRSLTICRPSLIDGERNETRAAEGAALVLLRILAPVLPKKLRVSPVDTIAAKLLEAVVGAKTGCHYIDSQEMN
jgi:uncharacterized protein YbjT (DUF2867 family)